MRPRSELEAEVPVVGEGSLGSLKSCPWGRRALRYRWLDRALRELLASKLYGSLESDFGSDLCAVPAALEPAHPVELPLGLGELPRGSGSCPVNIVTTPMLERQLLPGRD